MLKENKVQTFLLFLTGLNKTSGGGGGGGSRGFA